jgi:hypothetical protein
MTAKTKCVFTGANAEMQTHPAWDARIIESEICGVYVISRDLTFRDKFKRVKMGEDPIVRQGEINCARRCLELSKQGLTAFWCDRDEVDTLQKGFKDKYAHNVACIYDDFYSEPVDHSEKPDTLLECFADRLAKDLAFAEFHVLAEDQIWARICDHQELTHILYFLRESGSITFQVPQGVNGISEVVDAVFKLKLQITVKGWQSIREKQSFPNSNKVFIATQFKWPADDEIRIQAIEAIRRACQTCGYDAEIVGQDHTGNITDRIMADIRLSRFVIAELTFNNRGVYFEAGFARGIGRPVFHVVREGHTHGDDHDGRKIHFDLQQIMYRSWKEPKDLETQLTDWIESTVGKYGDRQ